MVAVDPLDHPSVVRIDDLDAAVAAHEELVEYTRLTDVALRRRMEPAGGLYMAESHQVIRRALAAGHRPRSMLMAAKWLPGSDDVLAAAAQAGAAVYVGPEDVLSELTGFHLHRGALAAMHRPELPDAGELLRDARRVVVLEDIVDHTNVGAIFRACAGFGVDAVLVTPRCADPLYRRSIRVSMGTVFQVPWGRIEPWPGLPDGPGGVATLRDHGFSVAALALRDDAVALDEFAVNPPERLAVLFGTEGDGLVASSLAGADYVVTIPMSGEVDSLNVAAAAAVTLWALR